FQSWHTGGLDGVKTVTGFDTLADRVRAANYIERILVKFIFVCVLPPLEFVWIHLKVRFNHRDGGNDGFECFAVGNVDLNAGTRLPGVLREAWLKIRVAEFDTRKVERVQGFGPCGSVDVGGAVKVERQSRTAA